MPYFLRELSPLNGQIPEAPLVWKVALRRGADRKIGSGSYCRLIWCLLDMGDRMRKARVFKGIGLGVNGMSDYAKIEKLFQRVGQQKHGCSMYFFVSLSV